MRFQKFIESLEEFICLEVNHGCKALYHSLLQLQAVLYCSQLCNWKCTEKFRLMYCRLEQEIGFNLSSSQCMSIDVVYPKYYRSIFVGMVPSIDIVNLNDYFFNEKREKRQAVAWLKSEMALRSCYFLSTKFGDRSRLESVVSILVGKRI